MGTAVPEVGVDASCPVVEALTAARPRRWLVPLVSPVIQKVEVLTGMSGRAVPSTLTCQWVAPAGAGGKVSRRAPSRDSTAGAAGVAGAVALGVVPVAGRERLGPFQSPAVARRAQGVPAVMPVNWLLAVPRGRVRLVLPTVSCQPVAPVGAVVGSLTVRVPPVTEV